MGRKELVDQLAKSANITGKKANQIITLFFNTVKKSLVENKRVEIRGFGVLTVREYDSYVGRNPKTGDKITIPSKKLPFWKTGLELKQRVDSINL